VKQEGSLAIKMETGNEFSSQTSPTIFSFWEKHEKILESILWRNYLIVINIFRNF
jgi:hypothetical protein